MAQLYFAGHRWSVRRSSPGPDRVAYAAALARVDADGRLSLRLGRDRNGWCSSEVESASSLGYGDYTFDVDGALTDLPAGVALAIGTYRNDNSALLIRVTRHGWDMAKRGEFVVPGGDEATARFRFAVHTQASQTRHVIAWRPHQVTFSSYARSDDMVGGIIAQWVYRGDQVPAALTERVRIALTTERDSQIVEPQELKLARFLFRRYTPVMVRRGGTL